MNDLRKKRVESLIRDQVSHLIMMGEVKDPRVNTLLSITSVEIASDMTHAKLFVSSLDGEAGLAKSVKALNHAAGFIQNRIGKQLSMRSTPRLTFKVDTSVRDGYSLIKKIDGLAKEEDTASDE